jgi:hypothetical protein
MPARLLACPSCARHIRVDEERCPFCGATCPETFASTPALARPLARTAARATAAVGSGVAIALALSCCEATHPLVLYGAPPLPLADDLTDAGAGDDLGAPPRTRALAPGDGGGVQEQ